MECSSISSRSTVFEGGDGRMGFVEGDSVSNDLFLATGSGDCCFLAEGKFLRLPFDRPLSASSVP